MEELTLFQGGDLLGKEGEDLLSRQWFSNGDITASVLPFVAIVGFFLFGWLFQLWLLLRVADGSFLQHRHRFHHHRHHRWGPGGWGARTDEWDEDDYYDPEEEEEDWDGNTYSKDWDTSSYASRDTSKDWDTSTYSSRSNKRRRRVRRPSYTN